jgi:hypothetical protein
MLGALMGSQWGCAMWMKQPAPPPSAEIRANLGTVGVVSAASNPELTIPEITTAKSSRPETTDVLERGAAGTAIGALTGMLIGALVGATACSPAGPAAIVCAGMAVIYGTAGGAGAGALAGAGSAYVGESETQASADSGAITIETVEGTAREMLGQARLGEEIRREVFSRIHRQTAVSSVALPGGASASDDRKVETVLELDVAKIGLLTDGDSSLQGLATPYVTVGGKLIRSADAQVIYANTYEKRGAPRAMKDWAQGETWRKFLEAGIPEVADEITDHLFIAEAPPRSDWLEKVKTTVPEFGKASLSWLREKLGGEEKPKDDPAQPVLDSIPSDGSDAGAESEE